MILICSFLVALSKLSISLHSHSISTKFVFLACEFFFLLLGRAKEKKKKENIETCITSGNWDPGLLINWPPSHFSAVAKFRALKAFSLIDRCIVIQIAKRLLLYIYREDASGINRKNSILLTNWAWNRVNVSHTTSATYLVTSFQHYTITLRTFSEKPLTEQLLRIVTHWQNRVVSL